MDPIKVFQIIFDNVPELGMALANEIENWPLRQSNLEKNCNIFNQLNKADLGVVSTLSKDVYELLSTSAYIRKALTQRGLLNMQYYILLGEALNTQLEQDGGSKQKGGMKLKQLLTALCAAFALVAGSEGVDGNLALQGPSGSFALSSSSAPSGPVVFSPPVPFAESGEAIQENRVNSAQKSISTLVTTTQPWVLEDRSIVIATGVTDPQFMTYFENTIGNLNARLASASKDATVMCGEIASSAADYGVFSNEAFVQNILSRAGEITEAVAQKSTSSKAQDTVAYLSTGTANLFSRLGSGAVGTKAPE